jgi:SAM-dependent methyltransferase
MPEPSERFDVDSVRDDWDAAASAYADAQATGRDFYRLELFGPAQLELCGEVRGRKVLDVGSGTGYFTRELARRGARVTGVDISPGMLAHAVEQEAREQLGIRYVTGDAARLNDYLGNDRFDLVTACLSLQDMPDIQKVLRAIHDALIVGGRLVASRSGDGRRTSRAQSSGCASTGTLIADPLSTSGRTGPTSFRRQPTTPPWRTGSYGFETLASSSEGYESLNPPPRRFRSIQSWRTQLEFRTSCCSMLSAWNRDDAA